MRTILGLIPRRCLSLSSFAKELPEHRALVVEKFGDPLESVKLKTSRPDEILPKELGSKQILVEHLVSCVNPADINLIQGVYGVKPSLPTIAGNEGIMRVKCVGSSVKHLKQGDWTLNVAPAGCWQSYSIQEAGKCFKVDNSLEVTTASQLKVNPCTAYRMIRDYRQLERNDVIIQNGANSAVGVYAIQLAKYWGYKTINIIRDRPNRSEIEAELRGFGADYVLTEEEVRSVDVMTPILSQIGKPKLFLNCVSGKNAVSCQRHLDEGGHSVTYGFMSKQPLTVGAWSMFRDHQLRFFWMARWYKEREQHQDPSRRNDISAMLDELAAMFKSGILRAKASTLLDFEQRDVAFTNANNTKYMFSISK